MNGIDPAEFASDEERKKAVMELVADVGNYKSHP
jgi:hypothetical protein